MWELTIPGDHEFYIAAGTTAVEFQTFTAVQKNFAQETEKAFRFLVAEYRNRIQ